MATEIGPLSRQFVLAPSMPAGPSEWTHQLVGDWHLLHSPDLPVTPISDNEGEGFLLGWRFGKDGDPGGRWVRIDSSSVQLDPLGTYSVVYHEGGVVASSTAAMSQDLLEENTALTTELNLPEQDHWYPFGLTPYHGVERLLPDHVLHLPTLDTERQGQLTASVSNDQMAAAIIARNLRWQFEALGRSTSPTMGLTAGHETRMLLSALRGQTDRVRFFTIGTDEDLDVRTAKKLSRRFGLRHEVWPSVRDELEEADWFERIGRCVAGAAMRNSVLKRSLTTKTVLVKGLGGEIGRGYYYQAADSDDTSIHAKQLLSRMELPVVTSLEEAATSWLDGLSATDAHSLLDRAYIENRLGCWAAPQLHGDTGPATTIWPLNQVTTINAMLSLSYEAKSSDALCPMVVRRLWPELLSIPVNGLRRDSTVGARLYNTYRRVTDAIQRRLLEKCRLTS